MKNLLIEKLRKGSFIIAWVCTAAVLCNLLGAGYTLAHLSQYIGEMTRYAVIRSCISEGILAVIMTVAAVMFFRIARDGRPFRSGSVRAVRLIAILFLVNALIPSVASEALTNGAPAPLAMVNPSAFIEGLLFLFISYMIRYGAMLQQESDETL